MFYLRCCSVVCKILYYVRMTKNIVKEWLYFNFLSQEFYYFLLTSVVQLSVSIFRKWVSASVHQFSHFVFSSCFKRRGNTNFLIFALSARIFLSLIETISLYFDNRVLRHGKDILENILLLRALGDIKQPRVQVTRYQELPCSSHLFFTLVVFIVEGPMKEF